MEETIYQDDFYKAAALAAKKATDSLQQLISSDTRVIMTNVERFEKPEETDARQLAKRCIEYYKANKVIASADIKIYEENDVERYAGLMLMFIVQEDYHKLGRLIVENLRNEEDQFRSGMKESAITETLNIIGNAYINVISQAYKKTIMSMVPSIVSAIKFDEFISSIISNSKDKLYIMFDTELMITKHVIKMPFLLAVALQSPESLNQKSKS
jgi:chemotaxis protein CheY-P-specific phosphatase CheC